MHQYSTHMQSQIFLFGWSECSEKKFPDLQGGKLHSPEKWLRQPTKTPAFGAYLLVSPFSTEALLTPVTAVPPFIVLL